MVTAAAEAADRALNPTHHKASGVQPEAFFSGPR